MNINDWSSHDKQSLGTYLQLNSYRSERYKIFYVPTPKVACTTVKWWFAALEGYSESLRKITENRESDPDLVVHYTLEVAPHITRLNLTDISNALSSDSYFRFALVRNPYKRIFSAWQSKLLLREPLQVGPYTQSDFYHYPIKSAIDVAMAFEGFLEHLAENEAPSYWDDHWTPQAALLRPDLINYSTLVKIEESEKLSRALVAWLGAYIPDPFQGRRSNESLIPYLPEFVTERSAELIRTLYAQDFDVFGYNTQPPTSKENFTTDQCNIAIKAIKLIRGRHQRLGERNGQIDRLNEIVGDQNAEILRLNEVVGDQDAEALRLNEIVGDQNAEILRLNEVVGDQNAEILRLNEVVGDQNAEILRLNEVVGELDNEINSLSKTLLEIYSSRGWRLLAPLRWYGRQRYLVVRGWRAIPRAVARAGGFQPLLRFVLGVLRRDGWGGVKSLVRKHADNLPKSSESVAETSLHVVEENVCKSGVEILFISHEASRTGAPVFLLNLIDFLKNTLEVGCVIVLRRGGGLEGEFRKRGTTFVLGDEDTIDPVLYQTLKQRPIRLIYSNTITNGSVQKRLRSLGCPIVCHVHELAFSVERYFGDDVVRRVLDNTDLFLAGSGAVANYLLNSKKVPIERVALAYPFIDASGNQKQVSADPTLLGLPQETLVVGACGMIGWRKGTDIFVQVAKRVLDYVDQPVAFVWVGGPLSHGEYLHLHHDVLQMELNAEICFLGEVEDHLQYFEQFDVFLLPSREDPFPLVAMDAASLGIPIVCFDRAGGAPELVEQDAGRVIPYLDVDAMAAAVIELLKDSALRSRLGERGRSKVRERHDIPVGARRIADLISPLIAFNDEERV